MSARTLTDADVEAIAERVAEIVGGNVRRRLTTNEVCEILQVEPRWVRDHAAELGATRLSDGRNSHLRFDPQRIEDHLARLAHPEPPTLIDPRRPGPEPDDGYDFPILPIPGEAA